MIKWGDRLIFTSGHLAHCGNLFTFAIENGNTMTEEHQSTVARLIELAIEYDKGDARRIHHFLKVHDFAATIGRLENIDEPTQFILESAAVVHDIGIHNAEKRWGNSHGHYQEIEGPTVAKELLAKTGAYTADEIDRICYLVGHHHTYVNVDGIDYRILLEADFLVNAYEDEMSVHARRTFEERVFRTAAGKRLLELEFDDCEAAANEGETTENKTVTERDTAADEQK